MEIRIKIVISWKWIVCTFRYRKRNFTMKYRMKCTSFPLEKKKKPLEWFGIWHFWTMILWCVVGYIRAVRDTPWKSSFYHFDLNVRAWDCAWDRASIDWCSFGISRLMLFSKSLLFSYFHSHWIKLSHLIEMSNVPSELLLIFQLLGSGIFNFSSFRSCVFFNLVMVPV